MWLTARAALRAAFDEARWTSKALNFTPERARAGRHDTHTARIAAVDGESRAAARDRAIDALFRYRVFPPHRMRAHIATPDGRVAGGATIIQRVRLGPLAMEMAVRVIDVFDERSVDGSVGFTYGTLEGHSERGLATFAIDPDGSDGLRFRIETWSSPAGVVGVLGGPIARKVQQRFTGEALAHFREHFREA